MKKISLYRITGCLLFSAVLLSFVVTKPAKMLLVGDSISMAYGKYLDSLLAPRYLIERKADDPASANLDIPKGANGGDSRMVLAYLKQQLNHPGIHPDILLLNCGLHDIKRDTATGSIAVTDTQYKRNLEDIVSITLAKRIQLIWITSTPIVDSIHNRRGSAFYRYAKDLTHYNDIAAGVCSAYNIPTIDLYSFTRQLGNKYYKDHAHFTEDAVRLQAAYIAGSLQMLYQKTK